MLQKVHEVRTIKTNISRQAPCCQEYSYHKTLGAAHGGATIKMKFTILHIAQKQLGLQWFLFIVSFSESLF